MKKTLLLILTITLVGCSTSQEDILPTNGKNMLDLWHQQAGGSQSLLDMRTQLRRPLTSPDTMTAAQREYTRTAENEVNQLFPRLPNPDLVMYVFPHLTGKGTTPVPGYSTVFSLHSRVAYALPGERTGEL